MGNPVAGELSGAAPSANIGPPARAIRPSTQPAAVTVWASVEGCGARSEGAVLNDTDGPVRRP